MVTILGLILFVIIVLCFINIRWGAILYLAYTILVPIPNITIGSIYIGDNIVRSAILLALVIDFKVRNNYKFSWKLLIPFLLYYLIELLIIPFQTETPFSFMINSWRSSFMDSILDSFLIYNVLVQYKNSREPIKYALITSILVAAIYGLFLTTTGGLNPYIFGILISRGDTESLFFLQSYFSVDDRMFGRISSVFTHPMTFGMFIGLAFVYTFSIRKNTNKILIAIILTCLSLNALFCGVRSSIGGLVVAISFYLVFSKNIKIGLMTLLFGLVIYNIILQMPGLSDYVASIADINNTKSNVSGSSLDLRIDQLYGCLNEIRNSPLLGKGFGWVGWYKSNFGDHPVILAFESLIYVILCNNGFLGIAIWLLLAYMFFRTNQKAHMTDTVICNTLFVFYVSYSCITGEYGYMKYFLLFYVCLAVNNIEDKYNNNQIDKKYRISYGIRKA